MLPEVKKEILRKSLHLPGLGVPFLFTWQASFTLTLLFLLSLFYLVNEWFRVHKLTRSPDIDLAPIYLALGLGLSTFFFPFRAALVGALLVCGGDVLAAIVGVQWGKKKIPLTNKTYLGSFTFLISSFCFLTLILGWKPALMIAFITSFIEVFSKRGLDNLFLPIVGGFLAS